MSPQSRTGTPALLLVTAAAGARGSEALAAAIATCAADERRAALLAEVGPDARPRRPTLLASPAARELEEELREPDAPAAARGLICHLAGGDGTEALDRVAAAVASLPPSFASVVHLPPRLWLAALGHPRLEARAALIRAELPRDRALVALAVRDLRRRGLAVRVANQPLGWAAGRRALAGVRIGGVAEARLRRWAALLLGGAAHDRGLVSGAAGRLRAATGQVLPAVVGGVAVLLIITLALVSIAGALTGMGRLQRTADLSALSAARSMRDDMARVTAPPLLPNGMPNPMHMTVAEYLLRARDAAVEAADANGADPARVRVSFPGAMAFPPLRARVTVLAELSSPGHPRVSAWAVAEAGPGIGGEGEMTGRASGGGYSGPLVYRNGEGMRPDVAAAFDRLAVAVRRAGISLIVVSGFRSDAEQAQLFAQHPDPKWVAPPGHSLHRCATELDLGPSSAYTWLYANARRFDFLKRYPWKPWRYGHAGQGEILAGDVAGERRGSAPSVRGFRTRRCVRDGQGRGP